jgi:hypothetical protein
MTAKDPEHDGRQAGGKLAASRDPVSSGFQETASTAILIGAARCWRQARDARRPVQPCLSKTLWAHDCPILSPVLDSLILFFERALGRSMSVGGDASLSDDEQLLLALVLGSESLACIDCPAATAMTLDCALHSTRFMMASALEARPSQ